MRRIMSGVAVLALCISTADAQVSRSGPNAGLKFVENRELTYKATVASQREIWPALLSCLVWPPGSDDLEITLQFGFVQDGRLITRPMVTYKKLGPDETVNKAFVAAAVAALDQCTPIRAAGEVRLPENARLLITRSRWSVRYR